MPEITERQTCTRKTELLEDIQTAMRNLIAIHNQEVEALLAEDFEQVAELEITLQSARDHKAGLIDLYHEHVMAHGC